MAEPHKKKIKVESPVENPYDSNNYLLYDILRIIFQYLNGKDLSSAAMVCSSWSEAARMEKCLRGPQCFKGPNSNEGLSFDCISQSTIKPFIGFFFIPCQNFKVFPSIKDLCKTLPKNCQAIMLFDNTVILNNVYLSQNMVCALLPQISNVKISMVRITNIAGEKINKKLEGCMQMIASFQPKHEESSCLMIFGNKAGGARTFMLSQFARRYYTKIDSCFGGIVKKLLTSEEYIDDIQPYCVALFITGSIKTWSVILKKEETEDEIEEKLKLFKEQVNLQKHSIGFMIATKYPKFENENYGKKEAITFKNLFPEVPLVGCFSASYYGKNTMYHSDYVPEMSNIGITFLILTYGSNIKK